MTDQIYACRTFTISCLQIIPTTSIDADSRQLTRAIMYYNLVQSFDARIYLCSTQMTFERRLIEDPAIKLILLFETNFSEVTRQALSSFCERSEPLHIITMRIVSIPEDDHDADAFSFTYGAFKFDDTYVQNASSQRVHKLSIEPRRP